jgi:hypothetical protein
MIFVLWSKRTQYGINYGSVADRFVDRYLAVLTVVGSDRLLAVRFSGFWALGGDFCSEQILFQMICGKKSDLWPIFFGAIAKSFLTLHGSQGQKRWTKQSQPMEIASFLANQ